MQYENSSMASGGVQKFFTEGLGKNNYTTTDFGGRNDILLEHRAWQFFFLANMKKNVYTYL